jgi:hypothetical protein
MMITGSPSEPGVNLFFLRSLQNFDEGSDRLAPADTVTIAGGEAPRQVKPDMVGLIKMQDSPVQQASLQVRGALSHAEIAQETITRQGEGFAVDIVHPHITGGLSEEAREKINDTLQSFAKEQACNFEEEATQAQPGEGLSSSIEAGFTTMANNDRFISFTAGSSSYVAGWAHPSNELATFNFDARTGRLLTFRDLFKVQEEGPDQSFLFRDNLKARREREDYALKAVSNYCIEDLKKQNEARPEDQKIDESLIREVAAPKEGKFDTFALTDSGLVIDFFYCHAAGYGEVTIPYEALADILDPESVLCQHAKKVDKKPPDEISSPEVVVDDDMIIIDNIRLDVKK